MSEFWKTLTALISNYNIADTASVFSIIEGLATVVAAGGAIIAIIVTKRIAKNQNALFIEQNKIVAAQVKIAEQQNKIALYKERYEVFELLSFLVRFSDAGVKLGFENKNKWDLNHRAKHYFLFWLQSSTNIAEQHPELFISFITIREEKKWVGWSMESKHNQSLSVTKSTFMKIFRNQTNLLQERKHLFNNEIAAQIEDVANAYNSFCQQITKFADFKEDSQWEFSEEPHEGLFQSIDSLGEGLEASRKIFQDKIELTKQNGLLLNVEKVITID